MRPFLLPLLALLAGAPAAAQIGSLPPAAFFGGHTTTVAFEGPQGPAALSLALDLDTTGWMHLEPLSGGRLAPTTRLIYRWWVAEDGRLCILYSPPAAAYGEHSAWSCYLPAPSPQGGWTFRLADGQVLPRLRHVEGNLLRDQADAFMARVQADGEPLPIPQPPDTPPPS